MEPDFKSWYVQGQELNAKCVDDTAGAERWELVDYGNKLGADQFRTHVVLTYNLVRPRPDDPDPMNWFLNFLAKEHGEKRSLHYIHRLSIATFDKLEAGLIPGIGFGARAEPAGGETESERSARRRAIVGPILDAKGWSVYQWEQEAGVPSKVAQRFMAGKTISLSKRSQTKLTQALALSELPH
jgi:hypothetical protein